MKQRRRERRRYSLCLYPLFIFYRKVYPWQYWMLKSHSTILVLLALFATYLFAPFLTPEFGSLPGIKGWSSWFWCKPTLRFLEIIRFAVSAVFLILLPCFSGRGGRWCRWWLSRRFRLWSQTRWKHRRCWNQGRRETCRFFSLLLIEVYCTIFSLFTVHWYFSFGVLCVCRMNCKGEREPEVLEISWPRSSPKIFPFFYL